MLNLQLFSLLACMGTFAGKTFLVETGEEKLKHRPHLKQYLTKPELANFTNYR